MVAWFKSEDASSAWKSAVGSWQARVTKGSVTRKGRGRTRRHISRCLPHRLRPPPDMDFGQHHEAGLHHLLRHPLRFCKEEYRSESSRHNHPNWLTWSLWWEGRGLRILQRRG